VDGVYEWRYQQKKEQNPHVCGTFFFATIMPSYEEHMEPIVKAREAREARLALLAPYVKTTVDAFVKKYDNKPVTTSRKKFTISVPLVQLKGYTPGELFHEVFKELDKFVSHQEGWPAGTVVFGYETDERGSVMNVKFTKS
jgi:hypothetical protein